MTLEEYMNLEAQIDIERTRISTGGRPVNEASYYEWRAKREEKKQNSRPQTQKEKDAKLTGIQLFKNFEKNNEVIQDDDDAEEIVRGKEEDIDDIDKDVFFKSDIKDDGKKILIKIFIRKYS